MPLSRTYRILKGIILILLIGACVYFEHNAELTIDDVRIKTENIIESLEKKAVQKMDNFLKWQNDSGEEWRNNYYKAVDFENKDAIVLAYENDSLVYWESNHLAVENYLREVCLDNDAVQLKNAFCLVVRHPDNALRKTQLYAVIPVAYHFPYENRYLKNSFAESFSFLKGFKYSDIPLKNYIAIGKSKKYFFLQQNLDPVIDNYKALLSQLLFLIFLFWLFYLIYSGNFYQWNNLHTLFIIWISVYLLLLLAFSFFGIPETWKYGLFFDVSIYANAESFLFPNTAAVLIFVFLVFSISWIAFRNSNKNQTFLKHKAGLLVGFAAFFFLLYQLQYLCYTLIQNSPASFDVNEFFSWTPFTIIGFIALILVSFACYFWGNTIMKIWLKKNPISNFSKFIVIALPFCVYLYFSLINWNWTSAIWPLTLLLLVYFLYKENRRLNYARALLPVLFFTALCGFNFRQQILWKEQETIKVLASSLADKQDDIAQSLFSDIQRRITKDTSLLNLAQKKLAGRDQLVQAIRQKYFGGYWENYKVDFFLFDSLCHPLIKAENPLHDNNSFFDEAIEFKGEKTSCENLFYVFQSDDAGSFIGRLNISTSKNLKPYLFYVIIEPKKAFQTEGYPELLLSRSSSVSRIFSSYIYAVYKNGKIAYRFGKYSFPSEWIAESNEIFKNIELDDYSFLQYKNNTGSLVLMGKIRKSKLGVTAIFAFFFLLFSSAVLIFNFLLMFRNDRSAQTLTLRIQLMMVSVVLFALILFGTGSYYYSRQQFSQRNEEALNEKLMQVYTDLNERFSEQQILSGGMKDYFAYVLQKTALIYKSDIHLFDARGNYYASSQPKVFEEGLISKKMNPAVRMRGNQKTVFSIEDQIGDLRFISAYQSLYNRNGNLLGYINLPYFARQDEREQEINGFIIALLNIYVFLFAISVLVALFIAALLTRPLNTLTQSFSTLKLGKQNQLLHWDKNDEIGLLVKEYNHMVHELEQSAIQLARSERESAWKEMARQVAHEIKNPLTPMKLNLQHLQRLYNNDNPDSKEQLREISKLLLEQIDSLAQIANEFSAFSQLAQPKKEICDWILIIKKCVDLYSLDENVQFKFNAPDSACMIYGDPEQWKRVFINIIKNAIQAKREDVILNLKISVEPNGTNWKCTIEDNGSGMSEETQKKIFTPNFSTKTEGMGLGLAMVKGIIESHNGNIHFSSHLGQGSTFIIEVPAYI